MKDLSSATYVTSIDETGLARFAERYRDSLVKPTQNAILRVRLADVTITVFAPKKGISKAVFQGSGAQREAGKWGAAISYENGETDVLSAFPSRFPQIGSDEVGTGDFFGPIEVCAAYVTEEDRAYLNELGVTDSKKMDDAAIRGLGPKLIRRFAYSNLSLDNARFNVITGENNMNRIKARLHNRVLLNLHERFPDAYIYQDQFAAPDLYYSYLKEEPAVLRDIHFATKGESLYPSVALGSVIARYAFLRNMDKLDAKYGVHFPLGSGQKVADFAFEFAKIHGISTLKDVAKTNFKTYASLVEKFV